MKKRYLPLCMALLISALAATALGGCKKENPDDSTTTEAGAEETTTESVKDFVFAAKETSLFIYRNGKITGLETDASFDKDYYDLEEFRTGSVEPVIRDYNKLAGAAEQVNGEDLPVSLADLSLSGTTLSLKLDYSSAAHFLAFNRSFNTYFETWNTFVVCKVSDAAECGLNISGAFTDAEGNAVSSSRLKEEYGDYYVCAVNFGGEIPSGVSGLFYFEGAIQFVSSGLKIEDGNSVQLSEGTETRYVIFQ